MRTPEQIKAELERIREYEAVASEGPWNWCREWVEINSSNYLLIQGEADEEIKRNNGRFAANARTDIRLLCEIVEELLKENTVLKKNQWPVNIEDRSHEIQFPDDENN